MKRSYIVAPWFPRNPLLSKADAEQEAQRESQQCWALPKDLRGSFLDRLRQRYADMLATELVNVPSDVPSSAVNAPAETADLPPRPLKRANADISAVVSASSRYAPTQDEVTINLCHQLELFMYSQNCNPAQMAAAYAAWHASQQHEK